MLVAVKSNSLHRIDVLADASSTPPPTGFLFEFPKSALVFATQPLSLLALPSLLGPPPIPFGKFDPSVPDLLGSAILPRDNHVQPFL